jgi:hypothetical protein
MIYPARSPWRANGDTAPLGVQAGSRFQFAENTGAFNDCGVTRRASAAERGKLRAPTLSQLAPPDALVNGRKALQTQPGPQSPLLTLIAVLTVPAIVVAVGLVWSQL